MSSFYYTNFSEEGDTRLSYNDSSSEGTVLVRSTNVDPLPYAKLFHFYIDGTYTDDDRYIFMGDLNTGFEEQEYLQLPRIYGAEHVPDRVIFDSKSSSLIILYHEVYSTDDYRLLRFSLPHGTLIAQRNSYTDFFKDHMFTHTR